MILYFVFSSFHLSLPPSHSFCNFMKMTRYLNGYKISLFLPSSFPFLMRKIMRMKREREILIAIWKLSLKWLVGYKERKITHEKLSKRSSSTFFALNLFKFVKKIFFGMSLWVLWKEDGKYVRCDVFVKSLNFYLKTF